MTLKNGLKSRKCSFLFNEQQLEKVVEFRTPFFSRESDSRDSVVRSFVRPSVRHAILKVL